MLKKAKDKKNLKNTTFSKIVKKKQKKKRKKYISKYEKIY